MLRGDLPDIYEMASSHDRNSNFSPRSRLLAAFHIQFDTMTGAVRGIFLLRFLRNFALLLTLLPLAFAGKAAAQLTGAPQGTYSDVPLHYTSEYGRLNPDEKLL